MALESAAAGRQVGNPGEREGREAAWPRALLQSMLAQRDLILVTGKGGTGKSTLVAALAQLAARRRGGACAVELSSHPRLPEMLDPQCGVEAVNIDPEQAVAPALRRLINLPVIVGAVLRSRTLRLFIRTSPAIREMIMLDELHAQVERCAQDRRPVIVDLPASGHALSFLDTPRAVHRMLRVGPLAQVAQRVEELILDRARCELVVVALPEELPVNETIELVRRAGEIGLASHAVIVNQVPVPLVDPTDRPLLELLRAEGDGALGRFAGAAESEFQRVEHAQLQIDRLRGAVTAQVLELPRFIGLDARGCASAVARSLGT